MSAVWGRNYNARWARQVMEDGDYDNYNKFDPYCFELIILQVDMVLLLLSYAGCVIII